MKRNCLKYSTWNNQSQVKALRKSQKYSKVLKTVLIACLCTLDEFSDEWNEEELLESLIILLTRLLNLLLLNFSEPFITL